MVVFDYTEKVTKRTQYHEKTNERLRKADEASLSQKTKAHPGENLRLSDAASNLSDISCNLEEIVGDNEEDKKDD